MSDQHTDADVTAGLRIVQNNPAIAQAVLDQAISKRPSNWSRRSNAPYYNEKYASVTKKVIDEMMIDRDDRLYPLTQFPGKSIETIYLRLNQSWRYVMEKMDPDGRYRKFNQMFRIRRIKDVGVKIEMIEESKNDELLNTFVPLKVVDNEKKMTMPERIDAFIESAKVGGEFHEFGLCLTSDQIKDIKNSMADIQNFICKVTTTEIKIVRIA